MKQKKEGYDWFGIESKKKPKTFSFLGSNKKKQKISSKVSFLSNNNPSFRMKPSPLFVKEKITTNRKRLSKWGDADLDGSPNYFDCDPTNWMKDAENPVMTNPSSKRNIFEKAGYAPAMIYKSAKKYFKEKGEMKEKSRVKVRKTEIIQQKEQQEKDMSKIENELAKENLSKKQKEYLNKLLKSQEKVSKLVGKKEMAESMFEKYKAAMKIKGPRGAFKQSQIAIDATIDAGNQPKQKQIAAYLKAEKKTKFFGEEGRARRLAKSLPGVAQVEGVASVLGTYGLSKEGTYTKAMRSKSARVKQMTKIATGQIFGSALTGGGFATSEPRGRGRPAGPTGEYKIGGKPVYEEEFRQWEIKQRSLNSMLPSNVQSQTLNPEYIAYMKAQEEQRNQKVQAQQMPMGEQQSYPDETMGGGDGEITVNEPVPSDQAPKTEGMTNEEVQAIEEARRRPYTRSSIDEIRQAQRMAQQQDQVLNAPNFMKGELKAAGGGILTATGPQIMDAPNVFKGEMRNINQTEDMPAVRLSERPQSNPYGNEYLEIEMGSGKPVIRKRITEKWMTGEAL